MTPPVDRPIVAVDRADPSIPVLLSGLAAAVVMRADGELHCSLDTRGAALDWGGVYAQGIRLTGPWELEVSVGGAAVDLPSALRRFEAHRWGSRSEYELPGVDLVQEVTPYPELPAVGRRLLFRPVPEGTADIEVISRLAPSLAAVLVEGVQPYETEVRSAAAGLELRGARHIACLETNVPGAAWTVNGRAWDHVTAKGEIREVALRTAHHLEGDQPWLLDLAVAGGVEMAFPPGNSGGPTFAGDAGRELRAAAAWTDWDGRCARFRFPDDPALEEGVDLARSALRSLYYGPEPSTRGLVAGFPWYCALWCRDLAWMLPAVIWLGDFDWAQASLATVFQFQAPGRIPILGAEAGELPMQVSPGPIFLYGTSDTSLYYPELVLRFLRASGRLRVADGWWEPLERVVGWARAKTDPSSGLFTNGGEVLELKDATDAVGSVHLGFDAYDTTIWDSADRRDHAVDLQVLYAAALRSTIELAGAFGHLARTSGLEEVAGSIEGAVRARFWWPEEGYLYDTLTRDGGPSKKVRPNALRAVSAGLLPPDRARSVVERALRDDLATPWGLRTLSTRDPAFAPHAYHEGQVWTIATAWAADAAFCAGTPDRGVGLLHTITDRIRSEHGTAHECYRGDRPEPYDSCFLLGFSVAPFLTVVFERLWGLSVDAISGTLTVRPAFPSTWRSAALERLRVGNGRVDLDWSPERLRVAWSGPGALSVTTATQSAQIAPGSTAELPLAAEPS